MKARRLLAAALLTTAALAIAGAGMTGHMVAHMIAVAVAAPLLALGLAGDRFDPARRGWARNPLAMSVVELAAVWLWHAPAVRAAVGHGAVAGIVELACFLAAGTLLWAAVLATPAEARAAGVGALLLTSMHMTLLGALVGLAPRLLYPAMAHAAPWGLSPIEDQQLAGVAMLAIGGAAYLLGGLGVLGGLLRERVVTA